MHRLKSLSLGALAAALLAVAPSAEAAQFTRGPYLQNVTPSSAIVAFRLDASCTPTVRYGEAGTTNLSTQAVSAGTNHAVQLQGLKAGTNYTYVVEGCGATSAPTRLRTAPVPGTRSVRFGTMGDFGTGAAGIKDIAAAMMKPNPDLFLGLGDVAYESGTEAEVQTNFFEALAPLLAQVPMFGVLGNHEYVTNSGKPYLDGVYQPTSDSGGERYYSFDWGHVHFVALDSQCALGYPQATAVNCLNAPQKAWLEKDLAASKAAWKIVFMHHPFWSSGEHGSNAKFMTEYSPIFEKYGVDLVLSGHDHEYERSYPMTGSKVDKENGIPYLVVGSGNVYLKDFAIAQPAWSAFRTNAAQSFLDVNIQGGTLEARLLSTKGVTMDSFTLTKELPPQESQPQPAPNAQLQITAQPGSGSTPFEARFQATTSLSNASVTWDFGDGTTGQGTQVTHTYARSGDYTVTATATSGAQSATASATVSVSASGSVAPPIATVDPLTPADAQAAGCNAAPAALLPIGVLAGLGALRRRRRRRLH
jgi:acid phosphatase type 7